MPYFRALIHAGIASGRAKIHVMWNDLKYLIAYLSPLSCALGIYLGGIWSPGAFYLGFIIIPALEFFVPASPGNLPSEEEADRNGHAFFTVLLYLHLPILYGLIGMYVWRVGHTDVGAWEILGMTVSLGIVLGTNGINVAHELGHRDGLLNVWVSRLLLVPSFYTHFTIEHNFGHHKHVGTRQDPATARRGETLYHFWWRSTLGSLVNAWRLERRRLAEADGKFISLSNQLLAGVVLQVIYLASVFYFGNAVVLSCIVISGVIGFLLLETVNYIEHYGLVRQKLESGRYEHIAAFHSWNSNHEIGRIFLYELVRHSDHHYRTDRRYQILRHLDEAPQLPTGYPGTMILATMPFLWRKVMDRRVESAKKLRVEG